MPWASNLTFQSLSVLIRKMGASYERFPYEHANGRSSIDAIFIILSLTLLRAPTVMYSHFPFHVRETEAREMKD